jgi:hypothetical protein
MIQAGSEPAGANPLRIGLKKGCSSMKPAPTRLLLAIAVTASVAVFGLPSSISAQSTGGPVTNSIQDAYHPIRVPNKAEMPDAPSNTSVAIPEGTEPLTLQAVKVGAPGLEPTIGVTSDGTAFYAAARIVVDTPYTWGGARTETLRSTDGGVTWENVQFKVAGESHPYVNADPFVFVDQKTDRVFNLDLYAGCSWLNYSDDKGTTWKNSPAACGNYVNDHQTIAVGPKPAAAPDIPGTGSYEGRWLYYCFNRVADANCGRSADGGITWSPTPQPAFFGFDQAAGGLCGGLHGHAETDPEGRLFIPKGHCGTPWIAITEDGGNSWSRVRVSDITTSGTHLSVASDSAGNLYFAWWDNVKRLPFLSISRDHGRTWEAPMMVAPPGVKEVNFPVISAGDEGRIAISFPSTTDPLRHDPNAATNPTSNPKRPWNQHVVVSENALDANPLFLSATANDPVDPIHRGACNGRCGGIWDFLDIVISAQGEAWGTASDDCVGGCSTGDNATALHAGEGIAIRQIGGPLLRVPEAPTAPAAPGNSAFGRSHQRSGR